MLRKWLWRLLGAVMGFIVGSIIAVALGDSIGKALSISNFEGGRGYFVAFVLLPLFAMGGAMIGALMVHRTWRFNLSLLAILFALAGTFVLTHRDQFFDPPPSVEQVGDFQILTYTTEGWGELFALRYQEAPFSIEGRAGMFGNETATYSRLNAVITFTPTLTTNRTMTGTAPAFIINVGDPNNTSFFYLVQQVDSEPKVTYLSDSSSNISADWLDQPPSEPTTMRDTTLHRGRLSGGRWLLLGDNCVVDTETWQFYPFTTYPLQDGSEAWLNEFQLPVGFAPDARSLVRVGTAQINDDKDNSYLGMVARLLVYNFVDGDSYVLPIDRTHMRYNTIEEIDQAWLDHHFLWQPISGEADRLVERVDFTPLPYHGTLTVDYDGYREYKLQPVKVAMFGELIAFLQQEFNAVIVNTQQYDEMNRVADMNIGEAEISLMHSDDDYSPPALSLWMARGEESILVETIAGRFDEALKSGLYDPLFLSDPVTN